MSILDQNELFIFIQFHNKSIIHGLVFFATHSFPLIAGIFCRGRVDAYILEGSIDITAALLLSL
uniref:Uncharacterized protein n=1 Tax=Rhizophagus irregularis (strain DAOM 181602 / DAOM 197198 / MUCL 43194) TaxID=747089 RepID=U9TP57_RHIID